MRITFDGYWLKDGPISNTTVLRELLRNWVDLYPDDELTVVVPFGFTNPVSSPKVRYKRVPKVLHPIFNVLFVSFFGFANKSDFVIFQNFAGLSRSAKVYIHDFIFLDHPEWFSKHQIIYFRLMPYLACALNCKIFTSTESEARRIKRFLPKKEVMKAPIGMRRELVNATPVRPLQLNKNIGRFIFTAGRDDPRKNLNTAIQSFMCSERVNAEFKMIVLGLSQQKFLERNLDYEPSDKVIFLDRCSDDELCWLYQNAALFLFISLDEGFGMPVLESLFFKTPSLISDIEVFKEVTGGNSNFADPRSKKSICQSLNSILVRTPSPHPNEIRPDIFSWKNSIEALRSVSK